MESPPLFFIDPLKLFLLFSIGLFSFSFPAQPNYIFTNVTNVFGCLVYDDSQGLHNVPIQALQNVSTVIHNHFHFNKQISLITNNTV